MIRSLTLLTLTAGLCLLGEARAAVVYYSLDIPIPIGTVGVSVDLETGSSANNLAGLPGGDANFFDAGSRVSNDGDEDASVASWQPVRTGTGNTDAIVNLTLGTTIDATTNFYSTGFGASGEDNTHMGAGAGLFTAGTPGYIGYSLVIDDPGNPGNPLTVYGWARVTFENNDTPGTLHEWAFDNTGAAIDVGVIPEPSAAALGLLAAGLALFRRRR